MSHLPDPELVDAVIDAVRRRRASNYTVGYPYELLADRWPAETVLDMMERLSYHDILECGVSLRTAWVCEYDPLLAKRILAFKQGVDLDEPAV